MFIHIRIYIFYTRYIIFDYVFNDYLLENFAYDFLMFLLFTEWFSESSSGPSMSIVFIDKF